MGLGLGLGSGLVGVSRLPARQDGKLLVEPHAQRRAHKVTQLTHGVDHACMVNGNTIGDFGGG